MNWRRIVPPTWWNLRLAGGGLFGLAVFLLLVAASGEGAATSADVAGAILLLLAGFGLWSVGTRFRREWSKEAE